MFLAAVLSYVLAHEITHLLQRNDHHARSGVMKARWDDADFAAIQAASLAFTETDIELIRSGLALRQNKLAGLPASPRVSR